MKNPLVTRFDPGELFVEVSSKLYAKHRVQRFSFNGLQYADLPLTWDRAAAAEKFTKTYANQKISASVGYSAQTGRKGEQ